MLYFRSAELYKCKYTAYCVLNQIFSHRIACLRRNNLYMTENE